MEFLSSHLDLSAELLSNIEAISNLTTSMVNRNSSISARETLNNTSRITAFDAATAKTSLSLQKSGAEMDFLNNNHITQLGKLSHNDKKKEDAAHLTEAMAKRDADSLISALAASETIRENSNLMDDFLLASDVFLKENNSYDDIDEFREKVGLFSDIEHDFPNPFVTDEVDMDFFMDYQKQLTLLFNHNSGEAKNIYDALSRMKIRLILNSLNIDILQNASFESNGSIEALTMQPYVTVSRAKADIYRRLMIDKAALTALDTQTTGSLLLTNVIIKSQKNLLLQEILKVKKQKNMLLALTMSGS